MARQPDAIDNAKRLLRASIKGKLAAMLEQDRLDSSTLLCARLDGYDALTTPNVVGAFLPLPTEPDVTPLLRRLQARGIAIALTRADWSNSSMHLVIVPDLERDVVPTRLGLREPRHDLPVLAPLAADAILVPGLAFDRAGRRLGRGKGFYDRFLPSLPRALRIGVAFDLQLVAEVPASPHDAGVHVVVTPSGVHDARSA